MVVKELLSPSMPPFTGRRVWFANLVFAIAGPYGFLLVWLIVAVAFLAAARSIWRHAPRLPGDRWL
jgi:hypothetical protein